MNRPADLIDPLTPAQTPPPRGLLAFFDWSLKGAYSALGLSVLVWTLAGFLDVANALLLGYVIDLAIATGPDRFFETHVLFAIGVFLFFVLLRPLELGASSAVNCIVIAPNVLLMVLLRLHHWTMGRRSDSSSPR